MKHCAICESRDHSADVFSCPFCGEASWIEASSDVDTLPETPVARRAGPGRPPKQTVPPSE